MLRLQTRLVARTLAALVLMVLGRTIAAQESEAKPAADESQARLRRAAEHMKAFQMRLAESKEAPSAKPTTKPKAPSETNDSAKDSDAKADDNIVELIDRPLLTYGDSARANENGTLWAFGKSGRPAAFLELFHRTGGKTWTHAVTLTSGQLVVMTTSLHARWAPEKIQIEPTRLPGASPPHAKQAMRTRQMKELARRFTAHEFWNPENSRFELRLLVQPVHRYSDAKTGLHDGAVFILAHGTNPEVILLIEALGERLETARWHYSLARVGSAELHVELDGKEVWKRERTPGVVGKSSDPYWLFLSPVEADE